MGKVFFKHTHNPVYKDLDADDFTAVFKKILAENKDNVSNPDFIINYYDQNDYEPVFVMDHLWNGDINTMLGYFKKADQHGLSPELFQPDKIKTLADKLLDKNAEKTTEEAYKDMAKLELLSTNAMINYSSDLQYGIISPKRIYARYYLKTPRPDSTSMGRVFALDNIKAYLDSIQPKSPEYLALQKAYMDGIEGPKMSKEETRRILLVNLERLRWKNKPTENKYVYVNIPDFHLDVIDSGKAILAMKVCVGQGRNKDYKNSLESYNDTCKIDNPNPHETPLLSSVIHSVEVNPIWNIPHSIATKEIIVEAAKDPYYLANKGINVYDERTGKLVKDPETINWSKVTKQNCIYEFRQQPGADNSLGKIKFLFDNSSSVYLHDTPAKGAFYYSMRAVSHGCVRLEKPLDLAHTLFRDTVKYNMIAKDMQQDDVTDPEDIRLRPKVPVYITYVTCWVGWDGQLQFRRDVYGLDIVLYENLKKYLPAE